jgi:hypothetical protein
MCRGWHGPGRGGGGHRRLDGGDTKSAGAAVSGGWSARAARPVVGIWSGGDGGPRPIPGRATVCAASPSCGTGGSGLRHRRGAEDRCRRRVATIRRISARISATSAADRRSPAASRSSWCRRSSTCMASTALKLLASPALSRRRGLVAVACVRSACPIAAVMPGSPAAAKDDAITAPGSGGAAQPAGIVQNGPRGALSGLPTVCCGRAQLLRWPSLPGRAANPPDSPGGFGSLRCGL